MYKVYLILRDIESYTVFQPVTIIAKKHNYDIISNKGFYYKDALGKKNEEHAKMILHVIQRNLARFIIENPITHTWYTAHDNVQLIDLCANRAPSTSMAHLLLEPRAIYINQRVWPANLEASEQKENYVIVNIPPKLKNPVKVLDNILTGLKTLHTMGILYGENDYKLTNGHVNPYLAKYNARFDTREIVWELINKLPAVYRTTAMKYLPSGQDAIDAVKAMFDEEEGEQLHLTRETQGNFLLIVKLASIYDIQLAAEYAQIKIKLPKTVNLDEWPVEEVIKNFDKKI